MKKLIEKKEEALEENYRKQNDLLQDEKAALESKRKELNDREPQHERRRLREHLTERLQTTISQPRVETGIIERRSNYFYLGTGLIFVIISAFFAYIADDTLNINSASFWAQTMKSVISGVAGAAFAWAGLSGLKTSATDTRKYEQNIQRYAFDMDRASWIVETILQMNSIEKSQLPDEWLEAVCQGLFISEDRKINETSSLEAFSALFDATASAKIGTNGIEFEVDKKGAKKLAKASE